MPCHKVFLLPLLIVTHLTVPALALIVKHPVSQLQSAQIPSRHNLDNSQVPPNAGDLGAFNLECFFCKRAVNKYRARVEKGTDAAEQAIGGLCKELKLQKDDVCDGIVQEFGPEVITVLARRLLDPHHVCAEVFHYCPRNSGRAPTEIPCNATLSWGALRGLVSQSEKGLALLRELGSGEVCAEDQWGGGKVSEMGSVMGKGGECVTSRSGSESVRRGKTEDALRVSDEGEASTEDSDGRGGDRRIRRPGESLDVQYRERTSETVQQRKRSSHEGESVSVEQQEQALGHFLQLTDIHLDLEYVEGSEVACGRPLCCRKEDGPAASNTSAAGPFGDYRCDAAPALFDSLAMFIGSSKELPKLDFAVFTGDVPPHDVWEESRVKTLAAMETVYDRLAVALKGVPLYPVLGNHAGVPVDSFPDPPAQSWLMDASWRLWKRWLPADAEVTVRKGGYYTLLHEPGLRIVGLNTQYCDTFNFWLLAHTSEPDPAGQLEWLLRVLADAEAASERVIILGHIPIGADACYVSYSQRYSLILDRFRNTVSAQIFGHTHSDSFKLYYDAATLTDPIAVGLVSPSVTPYTGRNPSFRVFDYRRPIHGTAANAILDDYKQYIFDLDSANHDRNGSLWTLEYGARSAYNLPSMSPKSWHALLQRLESEPGLLGAYLHRRAAGRPWTCDAECEKALLCDVKSQTFALYQECVGGKIGSFSAALKILLNMLLKC